LKRYNEFSRCELIWLTRIGSRRIGERRLAGVTQRAGRVELHKMVLYVNVRAEQKYQESGQA
jgi:hypothetical protein